MGVKEVKDIVTYNNLQLRNKIKKMQSKIDKLTDEEKKLLDELKKEAWKREMDGI